MNEHIKKSVLGSANSIDGCCALEHMTLLLIWEIFCCMCVCLLFGCCFVSFYAHHLLQWIFFSAAKHLLTGEHNFKPLTISFAFRLSYIRSVTKPISFFIVSHSILMGFYLLIDFYCWPVVVERSMLSSVRFTGSTKKGLL